MPALIGLYEDHIADRDRFVILAIHDASVKSFAELDPKLASIKKEFWQGKDLPFPVLLDSSGETERRFSVQAHPTGVLIDPDGKLVDLADWNDLEAKLPPVSLAKRWARHRDMQKHAAWSFEPGQHTLESFVKLLQFWTKCDVEIDANAVKACGLSPTGPLPGMLVGLPVTLRSIEELLLAPLGLGIQPSADGKKLRITRRVETSEPESFFQKQRTQALAELLDRGPTAQQPATKPLGIKDLSLSDAVKLISREFDMLPMALDAGAIQRHALDPAVKVNGQIDMRHLRKTLDGMLEPLGLKVVARDEVLLITPREQARRSK